MEKSTYENIDTKLDTGFNIMFVTMEHNSPVHWHRAIEILYILNGSATVYVEKKKSVLNPLDFIVIDSSKMHKVLYNKNHTMGISIHISKNFLRRYIPDIELLRINCSSDILNETNQEAFMKLCGFLKEMTLLYVNQTKTYPLRSNALVLGIASVLIEDFGTSVSETLSVVDMKNLERLEVIMDYIDEHYKEQISLQDAANKLMLNKDYFCRFFKKNIGTSFITYVNQVRIHHIYYDLVHTEDATMDIMERHGFFNQKLFYKMFKDIYDCTPRELRTLAKENPYM